MLLAAGCRGRPGGDDPSGTGTETGQQQPPSGSDSSDSGTPPDEGIDPASVPEPRAGRLTDLQYRYTVLDVLGVALTEEEIDALPVDIPTGRDYSTIVEPQFFNANYVLAYAQIARSVSARLDPAALAQTYAGCDGLDPLCRSLLIRGLGLRLYRRPLSEEEAGRYLALADAILGADGATEADVIRGIVQAMMQAPPFLYRIERETDGEPGTLRRIDGYELASRLSYFLWQSAPDEPLLEFAAGPQGDGRFDRDAVGSQVDRMIADDRFARARGLFWGDYTLALRSNFGGADPLLAGELRDSVIATLERMSGAGGPPEPLSALFDGSWLLMTPAVAELAGATPAGEGLVEYDIADGVERMGVVTHPGFLAAIGTTSFVGRGLLLTERLLCQRVAEPPVEAEDEIDSTAQATEDMTPREASEFRMGVEPVCQACHIQFEPVAYAFERYDILGRHALADEQGRELLSHGLLPAFDVRPAIEFADAIDLLEALAGLDAVNACLVENMTEFSTGLRANLAGDFHDEATARFSDEGLTFDALVGAVARSEQRTLMRVVEP